MNSLKYQGELFLLALSFFTRIPVSSRVPFSNERMNQSGRYFPFVGLIVGLICGACFTFLHLFLPMEAALFLTMAMSLMLTGAFHEDGLADMADGIGGGMSLEKRLLIMKDSRIGTYGSSALIMALLGKYVLLSWLFQFSPSNAVLIWVLGNTLSRSIAISMIHNMPYVSDPDTSKSKPLAQKQTQLELVIIGITGCIPCLFLPLSHSLILVVLLLGIRYLFKKWLLARLGGFTGDCLGGLQQICELSLYCALTAFAYSSI